jgi:5'-3' exonuclease
MVYRLTEQLERNVFRSELYAKYGRESQDKFDRKVVEWFVAHMNSAEFLPDVLRHGEIYPVWVWDTKAPGSLYWRHNWLANNGYKHIRYKWGRKDKSDLWFETRDYFEKFVKLSGCASFAFKLYEADDIAGGLVGLKAPDDYATLLTVDTDWLGLMSEKVSWVSSTCYKPQVRNNLYSLNVWSQSKKFGKLKTPAALWEYKALHGDSSDSLPKNSPISVINLLNPPEEYNLAKNGLMSLEGVTQPATPSLEAATMLRRVGVDPIAVEVLGFNSHPYNY